MWRYSTPSPEQLRYWLQRSAQEIPVGSQVGFSSPDGPGNAPLFRYWWARYWMADRTLIPVYLPGLKPKTLRTDYLITYGLRFDDPDFELVFEDWLGALYRRREPLRQP